MTETRYFSQSEVKAYRRCQMAHHYRYIQKLEKRMAPHQLIRGTVVHALLDAKVLKDDTLWENTIREYRENYGKLFTEEASEYPSPEELVSLVNRYLDFWKGDGLIYEKRSEIEVKVEYVDGMGFKGIIDKIPQDVSGRKWIADHKTHKVIPDEMTRFSDIQTVLYYWAARLQGLVRDRYDGILWDYIRTKPPTVPDILKTGGLTRRKNLDTDYQTYMDAIKKNKLDPNDYTEELARAKQNVFFIRIRLPSPNQDLVKSVVDDFFQTAREIRDNKHPVRNMSRDCKSCSYFQICSAEVRGLDSDFIRKSIYRIKEREHGTSPSQNV